MILTRDFGKEKLVLSESGVCPPLSNPGVVFLRVFLLTLLSSHHQHSETRIRGIQKHSRQARHALRPPLKRQARALRINALEEAQGGGGSKAEQLAHQGGSLELFAAVQRISVLEQPHVICTQPTSRPRE